MILYTNDFCGSQNVEDFIPDSLSPLKFINVVVNVIRREYPNDPLNFENTPEHIAAIRSYLFNSSQSQANDHPFRQLEYNAYDGDIYEGDPYL